MWRNVHSVIGLALSVLVMMLSLSGSILATKPVYDRITLGNVGADISVADMLRNIYTANADFEGSRLKRDAAGQLKLAYYENNRVAERIVDPATGTFLPAHKDAPIYVFMKDLHRSFKIGESGRVLAAIGAIAMLFLCVSGLALLLRRFGGVKQFFVRIRGRNAASLHAIFGRLLVVPLLVTSLTAVWLAGITFDLIPSGAEAAPAYPESLEELVYVDPWELHGLQSIQVADVADIVFPIPEDWFDVWAIKTDSAYIFVDQFTGDILSQDPLPMSGRVLDYVYFLHTAEGSAPWAVVLFISSLGVPFFAISGVLIWWRNRQSGRGRITGNASAASAKLLILVGSEGGTTWGFAKALHGALRDAGIPARIGAMNELRRSYPQAATCLTLVATYGDGDAPKSATRFLARVNQFTGDNIRHATLAFGDKAFPNFCGFAHKVDSALTQKFGKPLLPAFEIDKQSAQAFSHWGELLSLAMDVPLVLNYEPQRPKTKSLRLSQHTPYGSKIGAMTAVLRFEGTALPRHRPGDLVEIYPPGSAVPRLYSLGSSSKSDRFLEICVRHVEGGLCSSWLCHLSVGDEIDIAIRQNDRFQLPSRNPVVMIGAGTGIAPFTGMIRQSKGRRTLDLYWGGRHPEADWLYESSITDWLGDKRLSRFEPAWSREQQAAYVQDRLRETRPHLLARLRAGATIMVCGGQAMAAAVHSEIDILAAELGSSADELKRKNRYLEDVY
jgi:sulfite reductase (NADPH) flavoprotein alpha-component